MSELVDLLDLQEPVLHSKDHPFGPDVVLVTAFGAVGDDKTDCTAAFKNALASAKDVIVPNGKYCISDTIKLGLDGRGHSLLGTNTQRAVIRMTKGGVPAITVSESRCRLSGFTLDGRSSDNSVAKGTVGLVLGTGEPSAEKLWIQNLEICGFLKAGFVLNGLQNSTFMGCKAAFNKNNWVITNSTRNAYIFGCNSSDWPDTKPSYVPSNIWNLAPNIRGIYIGMPAWLAPEVPLNSYTQNTYEHRVPSSIFFYGNIHERYDRNDAVVEICEANGQITFYSTELTWTAKNGSLCLIRKFAYSANERAPNKVLQVTFYSPNFNQKNPEPNSPYYVITNQAPYPVRCVGYDMQHAVIGPAVFLDNEKQHVLWAQPLFDGGIEGWSAGGAQDYPMWSNNSLKFFHGPSNSGCIAEIHHNIKMGFKSVTGRMVKIVAAPAFMASGVNAAGDSWRIQMNLTAAPWVVDAMTLKPSDVNTEKTMVVRLTTGANPMTGAIRFTSATISNDIGNVATDGSATTITIQETPNDSFIGRTIRLEKGSGTGQLGLIKAVDSANKVLTIDRTWNPPAAKNTTYRIQLTNPGAKTGRVADKQGATLTAINQGAKTAALTIYQIPDATYVGRRFRVTTTGANQNVTGIITAADSMKQSISLDTSASSAWTLKIGDVVDYQIEPTIEFARLTVELVG